MIKTIYGGYLHEEDIIEYLNRLVGRIWKLLPLYEEDYNSFAKNHKSLMNELCGGEKIVLYCGFYVELINKLEALTLVNEHAYVKKYVRECIDLVNTLKEKVGEWEIGN